MKTKQEVKRTLRLRWSEQWADFGSDLLDAAGFWDEVTIEVNTPQDDDLKQLRQVTETIDHEALVDELDDKLFDARREVHKLAQKTSDLQRENDRLLEESRVTRKNLSRAVTENDQLTRDIEDLHTGANHWLRVSNDRAEERDAAQGECVKLKLEIAKLTNKIKDLTSSGRETISYREDTIREALFPEAREDLERAKLEIINLKTKVGALHRERGRLITALNDSGEREKGLIEEITRLSSTIELRVGLVKEERERGDRLSEEVGRLASLVDEAVAIIRACGNIHPDWRNDWIRKAEGE
jgi:chromosome segregation ATPase